MQSRAKLLEQQQRAQQLLPPVTAGQDLQHRHIPSWDDDTSDDDDDDEAVDSTPSRKHVYNLGVADNLRQFFGKSAVEWLLPHPPKGNGVHWKTLRGSIVGTHPFMLGGRGEVLFFGVYNLLFSQMHKALSHSLPLSLAFAKSLQHL